MSGDLADYGIPSECEISLWWRWQATAILLPLHLVGNEGSWGYHEVLPTMEARLLQFDYIVLSCNCSAFTMIILKQKWSNNLKSSSFTPHGLKANAVIR